MSTTAGLLAMLTHPALRVEVERVGAAVGLRVVHVTESALSQKNWSAAAAVILDGEAAARCAKHGLSRRAHVVVLTDTEPTAATWQAAISVGAHRVLTLPAGQDELIGELADAEAAARDPAHRGTAVAVVGARGGAGASLFATALAQTAGTALLVDVDPAGGGIDLLCGTEKSPGLRWPDLALQGGRLSWPALRDALPRVHGVSVLSGTKCWHEPDARAVDAVIDAGRRGGATVVCDLPRAMSSAAVTVLDSADLVVLVSPCDVRACAAGSSMASRLRTVNPNIGVVVRGPAPGGLRAAEVAVVIGVPLLAAVRVEPGLAERIEYGGLRLRRRSALASAARRVLDVLPARSAATAVAA